MTGSILFIVTLIALNIGGSVFTLWEGKWQVALILFAGVLANIGALGMVKTS